MNLGDFLKSIAAKSGIEKENKDLTALLESPALHEQQVPESIVSQVNSSLMTVDAAKNDPAIIKHFRATHFNGIDAELDNALKGLGIEDSVIAELKDEQSTPKRMTLALKKVQDLEKSKAGASKGEKAELQKEIDDLNGKIRTMNETFESEKTALQEQHSNQLYDNAMTTMLSGYKFALPDEMDASVKLSTVKGAIAKHLEDNDASASLENGSFKLLRKSTGADYYDQATNQKLDYKSMVDQALSKNKLLKTVEKPTQPKPPIATPSGDDKMSTASYDSALDTAIKDLDSPGG